MKIQLIKVHKVKALFVSFVILKRTITIGRSCFISWPNNRQQRVIADSFPKVPLSIFIFPPPFLVFFYFFFLMFLKGTIKHQPYQNMMWIGLAL